MISCLFANGRDRHHQRHAQGRVIRQHPVRELAVIAEPFAVIAGHRHHGVLDLAGGAQPGQHARDLRVGEGDLAVVGVAAGFFQELLRRIVGRVRIVEMNPGKERLAAAVPEPLQRGIDDDVASAFGFEPRGAGGIARHPIVVGVEADRQAEPAIEDVGADKRAGAIARVVKGARERRPSGERDAVQADAVFSRQRAGHDRGVGRKRQRHRAARVAEAHAARRQPVDRRRQAAPDPVRAQGVDGDEEDVGFLDGSRRRGPVTGREQQEHDAGQAFHAWIITRPGSGVPGDQVRACTTPRGWR